MGLSKDFTGLSELLLGQAQPAQFQSSGQTGYWWGSIYNNDWEVLDGTNRSGQYSGMVWNGEAWVENNSHTDMPRSYNTGGDGLTNEFYYNWYAAVAESATYDTTSSDGNMTDSICPAGWQLPVSGTETGAKSSWNLLVTSYDLLRKVDNVPTQGGSNSEVIAAVRKLPFNTVLSGQYSFSSGRLSIEKNVVAYWSTIKSGNTHAEELYASRTESIMYIRTTATAINGQSVRCVQK